MKKLILFCIFFCTLPLAHAETCYTPPPGYVFRVAAWGDHRNEMDYVRCHYYSGSNHIEIKNYQLLSKNAFLSHANWHGDANNLYFLCTSFNTDINECPFG